MAKKYTTILFDFDGTLVDTGECFSSYTEKFYKNHGLVLDPNFFVLERPYNETYFHILRGEIKLDLPLLEKFIDICQL